MRRVVCARPKRVALLLVCVALSVRQSVGFELFISRDRLTLQVEDVPLRQILARFSHAGVRVMVDPFVHKQVSARFDEVEMQEALDAMLQPFSYVLFWDVLDGPLGKMPRLAKIQVFMSGHRERVEPLERGPLRIRVSRGPDDRGPAFVQDEILLAVKPGTDLDAFRRLLAQIGGTLVESCPSLGVYRVRLPPGTNVLDLVAQLRGRPIIAAAEPNYVIRMQRPVRGAAAASSPSADAAGLPRMDRARVAVLDTGLAENAGLGDLVIAGLDALEPEQTLADTHGHGTQMALIAAGLVTPSGLGAVSSGQAGPIISVRAFDDTGNGTVFGMMRSIEFAVANGARVINLSWSTETDSQFFRDAVGFAQAQGAVVVAAAGNEPTGKPVFPASLLGVVGVAALGPDGTVWASSNHGAFIDLAAPGHAVIPASFGKSERGQYVGTSIASAFVTHALACYFAKYPEAGPVEALTALRAALSEAGPAGRDALYGSGALDAAAVARLLK